MRCKEFLKFGFFLTVVALSFAQDPRLQLSTYCGGNGHDAVNGVAFDSDGNMYVTGYSNYAPFMPGAPYEDDRAFLAKLNQDSELVYFRFLSDGYSMVPVDIVIDDFDNIYITGRSHAGMPLVHPVDNTVNAGDGFIIKFAPDGHTVLFQTYLGGEDNDYINDISVDGNQFIYIAGYTRSTNEFPLVNPISSSSEGYQAFVTKIDSQKMEIVFSTFLGGSEPDSANGIAFDQNGNTFITGSTSSSDFPLVNPIYNTIEVGTTFVTKISESGSTILASTFLSGSELEYGNDIAIDSQGNVWVTGETNSPDFPLVNPFNPEFGGGGLDVFITKFNSELSSILYSSYFGSSGTDYVLDMEIENDEIYLSGYTSGSHFPLVNPLDSTKDGVHDAYVSKFTNDGQDLLFSTFWGGSHYHDQGRAIAVLPDGDIGLVGMTESSDFQLLHPIDSEIDGNNRHEGFITRFSQDCVSSYIAAQPRKVLIEELGSIANFRVIANGESLFYQWFHDGNPITLTNSPTLTLATVGSSDLGFYYCEISSACGTLLTESVELKIAPMINVEVDWMYGSGHSHRPSRCNLDAVKEMFYKNDIILNYDISLIGIDEDETWENGLYINSLINLDGVVDEFSGSAHWNHLAGRYRNSIYYDAGWNYAIIGHSFQVCGQSTTKRGVGETSEPDFIGRNLLITLGAPDGNDHWHLSETFMHELGHNLGIKHGGDNDYNRIPNYPSIMNYRYGMGINQGMKCFDFLPLGNRDFHNLDYSHGILSSIHESTLNENQGIGYQPIDWNCDGDTDDVSVSNSIVYPLPSTLCESVIPTGVDADDWCIIPNDPSLYQELRDHDDWQAVHDFLNGLQSRSPGIIREICILDNYSYTTGCSGITVRPDPCAVLPYTYWFDGWSQPSQPYADPATILSIISSLNYGLE